MLHTWIRVLNKKANNLYFYKTQTKQHIFEKNYN